MTRDGEERDIAAVVDMAREFWRHTMYEEDFNGEHVGAMARYAMGQGLLAVLEVDGKVEGFTAGIAGPILGNPDVLQGTEIAWWINPDARRGRHGLDLLHHIEGQARSIGVKYWNMISMESCAPQVAERIYISQGYERSETSFTRVL